MGSVSRIADQPRRFGWQATIPHPKAINLRKALSLKSDKYGFLGIPTAF
jgi:hypothetical protein